MGAFYCFGRVSEVEGKEKPSADCGVEVTGTSRMLRLKLHPAEALSQFTLR